MGCENSDVVKSDLGAPPLRSNDGSLTLVSCLSGGYKFASDLRWLYLGNSKLYEVEIC